VSELELTDQTLKATPVQAKERIEFVDILRGFAVFGILAANMAIFSGQSGSLQAWSGALDRAVVLLIRFLVTAKFYSLFSLVWRYSDPLCTLWLPVAALPQPLSKSPVGGSRAGATAFDPAENAWRGDGRLQDVAC
jgi:hypothetical protein